jgi:hypothetical protein
MSSIRLRRSRLVRVTCWSCLRAFKKKSKLIHKRQRINSSKKLRKLKVLTIWMIWLTAKLSKNLSGIKCWTLISTREGQQSTRLLKTMLKETTSRSRVTGLRLKTRNWPKLSESTEVKTGSKLQKLLAVEQMCNASIDGKRFSTQLLWKVLGQI